MRPEIRSLRYVDALREAVAQEMERDSSVFVMGLDVDDHKAIQGSTRGLLAQFGPRRVFTTPLSEDAMTGIAIGAAMAGMRPIHVHIRMDFLLLCMNQLINIAAKAHYMYGGSVSVPLVVRSMIGKSWGQGAQHSQGLHSLFMHIPGLKVVLPSNAHDAKGLMIAAIRDNNPVIFVEHRLLYGLESHVP
jgi:pyruvate dehydrogenase E1 component beta subunit